ncbi:MAG: polysaccharide pyruvyl transferase family protein [Sulfurovaceae bacterium]
MKEILRSIYHKMRALFHDINPLNNSTLRVHWSYKDKNFGDVLNPILISKLSGQKVFPIRSINYSKKHYLVIGSILQYATRHSIVWGSGFIAADSHCIEKPSEVCAVRGPLSRKKLMDDGIECPEIYGDPALLLPAIYQPAIKKKYTLGIIPHYVDKHHEWIKKNISSISDDILLIDVINGNPLEVVDAILSCEQIASSSLHGLIISDAYKIPSLWIEFSGNLLGGHFKFFDYFASVEKDINGPYYIAIETTTDELKRSIPDYVDPKIDLQKLIEACPFNLIERSKLFGKFSED